MEGGELYDRINERRENPYSERDAARFISMIVQAVAHLHEMDIVRLSSVYFCSL
jgi:serine/threonine protein kinase